MEDTYIHIRIKKKLKEQLLKEAEAKNISLNAYINIILNKKGI